MVGDSDNFIKSYNTAFNTILLSQLYETEPAEQEMRTRYEKLVTAWRWGRENLGRWEGITNYASLSHLFEQFPAHRNAGSAANGKERTTRH